MSVLCANYQAAIWRRCLERRPFALDPKTCGCVMNKVGNRTIELMRGWITSSQGCVAVVFMQMCPRLQTSRLCVPGEQAETYIHVQTADLHKPEERR
jgi:hypothetical protein